MNEDISKVVQQSGEVAKTLSMLLTFKHMSPSSDSSARIMDLEQVFKKSLDELSNMPGNFAEIFAKTYSNIYENSCMAIEYQNK